MLGELRHPGLSRSLELVWDADGPGHVMEYVPAVPWERIWEEGGEEAVRTCLVQAWRGLRYLHRHGWVHGDVTPGNVLVWTEGARWRSRLVDMGLSCRPGTMGIRGTVGYASPEVMRGDGIAPESDWYGLSAVGHAWVMGRWAWGDLAEEEVAKQVAKGASVPLPRREVGRDLRGMLEALGHGDAAKRSWEASSEVQGDETVWGPRVQESGLWGMDGLLPTWLAKTPERGTRALVARGGVGSGRKAAVELMARALEREG